MPVFDSAVKVATAVKDASTDKCLPALGSLSSGAIDSPGALAGTTGSDCKLVHGDRWEQIDGNHTECVELNRQSSVKGNEARTIMQNQDLTTVGDVKSTVVGNLNHSVVGAELHTNIGVQNHTRMSPRVEVYAGDKNTEDPGRHFIWLEEWIKIITNRDIEYSGISLDASEISIDFTGASIELPVIEIGKKEIKTELVDVGNKILDLNIGNASVRTHIAGLALATGIFAAVICPRLQQPAESLPGVE
jgi:hypothetical protein